MAKVKINKVNRKIAEIMLGNVKIGIITYSLGTGLYYLHDLNNVTLFKSKDIQDIEKYVQGKYVLQHYNSVNDVMTCYQWVVEKYNKFTRELSPVGEVLFNSETLHLSNYELEEIWNLCNFTVSNPEMKILEAYAQEYDGRQVYISDSLKHIIYFPYEGTDGVANCDIFIHPITNDKRGYYLVADVEHNTDRWKYTENDRDIVLLELRLNSLTK